MFKAGNRVTEVNHSLSNRIQDPKLAEFVSGYAYGSEKKLIGSTLKVIGDFTMEIDKGNGVETTDLYFVQNMDSKYNEVYAIKAEALVELDTPLTIAEMEKLTGITSLMIDEGEGEDTIIFPTIESLNGKICQMVNGSFYFITDGKVVGRQIKRPLSDYDEKLCSSYNASLDIDKVYTVTESIQLVSLTPDAEAIEWKRPVIKTLDEISGIVGYKVTVKKEN